MENFVVSARKYRPDKFYDVVGQDSITNTLKNSIKKNHLGHAYLFSGPRGVGKTTCARIFAKTINCFSPDEDGEACNACESCKSFNSNRSYNIHELDAASNNSVEDIRNLTEQVRVPPQVGAYSVYIIDEVHMLSSQAFNAFLKTLEEPPAHAVFILATTEKHKIIPTILSRCQIYDFNRIGIEDIVNYLKGIAGKEQIKYEEDALQIIARKADGSLRDALSVFDQIVSFSGNSITYSAVIENLNILDFEYYFRLTEAFLQNDISSSLILFDEVLRNGFDARNFINGYADHLRDLLVCMDPQTVQLLEVGAGIKERYLEQSQKVDPEFVISGLDICSQADIYYRASKNPRLTIELALVKLARLVQDQKKKIVEETKTRSEETLREPEYAADSEMSEPPEPDEDSAPSAGSAPEENITITRDSISIKDSLKGSVPDKETEENYEPEDEPPEDIDSDQIESVDATRLLEAWNKYADSLEARRPRIYSTLKSHQPVIESDGTMKIILNTEAQRDNFIKNIKPDLIEFLKRECGSVSFNIEAGIEENQIKEKKIYTIEDRLDYLTSKNPELTRLKNLFNLDFDD